MDWPRTEADLSGLSQSKSLGRGRATISEVTLGPEKISFTTNAVGVPHLVRASFFPNWVSVGASGPYRAAPSFMVVIPTSEEVELVFVDTWVEWTGRGLTLLGLLIAMFTVARAEDPRSSHPRRRQPLPSYGRR